MQMMIEIPEELKAVGAAAIERTGHQAMLQGLDVDHPRVRIDGTPYPRVGRYAADVTPVAQGRPGCRLKICSE